MTAIDSEVFGQLDLSQKSPPKRKKGRK